MVSRRVVTVTPAAASFVTQYSSGDVIGAVNEIPLASVSSGLAIKLDTVVVLDKANQKASLDLVFFNENPATSIGTDNNAYALDDTDLTKVVGRFSITGSDYVSSSTTNAEVTYRNVGLTLGLKAKSKSLWMAVISRGTPTYGSASDLIVKLALEQD